MTFSWVAHATEMYYVITNIHARNSSLHYSADEGVRWSTITVSTCSYGIDDINDEVQCQL